MKDGKMKVWMAWFDVQYEGEYGHELFFKREDAQKYLDENVAEYGVYGDSVDCRLAEVEVR